MSEPSEPSEPGESGVPGPLPDEHPPAALLTPSGSVPITTTEAEGFAAAEAHALASASLLDDPAVPPWTAAEPLRRGFSALARAAGMARPEPAATLDTSALPWLGSPQAVAEALRTLATDDDATLDRNVLVTLSRALCTAVATAADARFDPGRRLEHRRRLVRRTLMGVLVAIPVVVGLVLTVPDFREGPWRGQYFSTPDFQGDPLVRRDGDIHFDWKRQGPVTELPKDGFSVRWDTCLELPEALEISFQLVSDDGSRLVIDGEVVVDNWGRHGQRSRGADVPLAAGMHHIRLEYFDDRHAASVELLASLRGELPEALPVRLLRYPGDDLEADALCTSPSPAAP